MRFSRLIAIGFCLAMCAVAQAKEAKKMEAFAFPAAKYADFALSKDAKSWDIKHPVNRKLLESGAGQPLRVGQENKAEKSVQLYAASCQSVLKMPLGWFGLDDGGATTFWTPDEKTRILCRFTSLGASAAPTEKNWWPSFKTRALAQMKKQMPKAHFRPFDLKSPPDSFGIEASGLKSESGRDVKFVQIFTRNSQIPGFALSLSLTSPAKDYAHNLGLIGLILRDRKVQWGN